MWKYALAVVLASAAVALTRLPASGDGDKRPWRQMEPLGRGVVAVHQGGGKVFVGWRLLGTDRDDIGFHVYRTSGADGPTRLTRTPLTKATWYQDSGVDVGKVNAYFVRPVLAGKEGNASAAFRLVVGRRSAPRDPRPHDDHEMGLAEGDRARPAARRRLRPASIRK